MGKRKEEIALVRGLRKRQTDAERALWNKLKDKQIEGVKFRRQQPIGSYIVDFVSLERRLIIEIDGGQHNERKVKEKDTLTLTLSRRGRGKRMCGILSIRVREREKIRRRGKERKSRMRKKVQGWQRRVSDREKQHI